MLAEDYTEEDVYLERIRQRIDDLSMEIRYVSHLNEEIVQTLKKMLEEGLL